MVTLLIQQEQFCNRGREGETPLGMVSPSENREAAYRLAPLEAGSLRMTSMVNLTLPAVSRARQTAAGGDGRHRARIPSQGPDAHGEPQHGLERSYVLVVGCPVSPSRAPVQRVASDTGPSVTRQKASNLMHRPDDWR